jgi:hypothetical protein
LKIVSIANRTVIATQSIWKIVIICSKWYIQWILPLQVLRHRVHRHSN